MKITDDYFQEFYIKFAWKETLTLNEKKRIKEILFKITLVNIQNYPAKVSNYAFTLVHLENLKYYKTGGPIKTVQFYPYIIYTYNFNNKKLCWRDIEYLNPNLETELLLKTVIPDTYNINKIGVSMWTSVHVNSFINPRWEPLCSKPIGVDVSKI